MKIYSIRDRFLDYFQQPFFAPSDNQVMAALAARINNAGEADAVAQTPQHFELWRLATFNEETGTIKPAPEFVTEVSTLARTRRESTDGGNRPVPTPPLQGAGEALRAAIATRADQRATAHQVPPGGRQGAPADHSPGGSTDVVNN